MNSIDEIYKNLENKFRLPIDRGTLLGTTALAGIPSLGILSSRALYRFIKNRRKPKEERSKIIMPKDVALALGVATGIVLSNLYSEFNRKR